MATAVTEELSFSEEIVAFASESGFERRELTSLKRVLAKKSERDILEALRKLSNSNGTLDASAFVGELYSLTLTQLLEFEGVLKTIDGWD